MTIFQKKSLMTLSLAMSLALVGCGASTEAPTASPQAGHDDHAHEDDHEHEGGHAHPSEGPHHGGLIELGEEEYHAEIIDNHDTGAVTIYMLDSAAKNAVPINATELVINLKHDGQAEQFTLTASPEEDDPAGKSSRFVITDADLADDLDHEGADAKLVVTIGDKQYRGDIQGHGHDHDDHEGHDAHEDDHDH